MGTKSTAPFVSVVIPTHGRPERLVPCLEALAVQDLPRERFEVIIVDDGSPVPPTDAVMAVSDRIETALIRQSQTGPAGARNTGAARARGELLVFTDDDCVPDRSWLRTLCETASRAPGAGVGGLTVNLLVGNPCSAASQMLIDYLYETFNRDPDDARFFASNNLALPTASFRRLGGFSETFPLPAGEDRELCDRWHHAGLRLVYTPDAMNGHQHALDLASFWRQHFRYGRGAHEFRRIRSQRGEGVGFEGISFYARLILRPFSRATWTRALALSGLLLLSQVGNTAGFLWELAREPMRKSTANEERT
jgi:GT2 family glycosyltransferase